MIKTVTMNIIFITLILKLQMIFNHILLVDIKKKYSRSKLLLIVLYLNPPKIYEICIRYTNVSSTCTYIRALIITKGSVFRLLEPNGSDRQL